MNKIDIVIDWVDGNDPVWKSEKQKYRPDTKGCDENVNRYRDWKLMRYWFRGIETFAPWVNHVYLVTCGHHPEWLNLDHPKLTLVKHSDYIPKEYLPTFNSNVIELYYHKIKGLSEQFVLFNDDMFVISPTTEVDFFVNGIPRGAAVLDAINQADPKDIFPSILLNNAGIINKNFSKKKVLKKNRKLFFYPGYGKELIFNILLYPFKYFSTFRDPHLPSSLLKSTYEEVWEKEQEMLTKTMKQRFRSKEDCNQWLFKNWQICKGMIVPQKSNWGKKYELGKDKDIFSDIRKQKYKVICINDSDPNLDFDALSKKLQKSFQKILPEKSHFEL